jgi:hypothetical protein
LVKLFVVYFQSSYGGGGKVNLPGFLNSGVLSFGLGVSLIGANVAREGWVLWQKVHNKQLREESVFGCFVCIRD